jgi:hypothetical protein
VRPLQNSEQETGWDGLFDRLINKTGRHFCENEEDERSGGYGQSIGLEDDGTLRGNVEVFWG